MDELCLLFAASGLELVPRELWEHPAVKAWAKRRGKRPGQTLLDVSIHRPAMLNLGDAERRGRPDIVHFCSLLALGSLLNRNRLLSLHIHTYDGKIIRVSRHVKLPRNYNRFIGLMEQLLVEEEVPPGSSEPLLQVLSCDLSELMEQLKPSKVYLLTEKGYKIKPVDLARNIIEEKTPMVIIGCFQAGDFSSEFYEIADETVSISQVTLEAWNVTARVLSAVEDALDLH